MPNLPRRPCAVATCPNLAEPKQRYCSVHVRYAKANANRGNTTKRGYGREHQQLRQAYLVAQPWCMECLRQGRRTFATELHHKDGNPHNVDAANLEGLCASCHRKADARRRAQTR